MSRRRMIDPNIWVSEDVARLSIFERLLLIGLFSNADDYGKGRAHPAYVRSTIFPYDDIPLEEIETALQNIQKHINIIFYEVDGSRYYKFLNWDKWQTVQKPQESKIPDPPAIPEQYENNSRTSPESFQNHSGMIPESIENDSGLKEKEKKINIKEKQQEINIKEFENNSGCCCSDCENISLPSALYDEDLKRIAKAYSENGFGVLPPAQVETVLEYAKEYSTEWVIMAIQRASLMGRRNLAYVHGILKRWKEDGQPDLGENASRSKKRDSPKYKKFDFSV